MVQASSIEKVVKRVDTPEAMSDLKTITFLIYLNLKVGVLRRQYQYPEYHQHKISTVRHRLPSIYLFWHMHEPIFKISLNKLYNK